MNIITTKAVFYIHIDVDPPKPARWINLALVEFILEGTDNRGNLSLKLAFASKGIDLYLSGKQAKQCHAALQNLSFAHSNNQGVNNAN